MGASPDLYNVCGRNRFRPRTGDGYAGILIYDASVREYVVGEFSSPLDSGVCYFVEFYVALRPGSKNSTDDIHAYISDNSFYTANNIFPSPFPLVAVPQIVNSVVINDTTQYTRVSGVYTASGGETRITIGNFNDNANTTKVYPPWITWSGTPVSPAYYYVDDVTVKKLYLGPDLEFCAGDSALIVPNIVDTALNYNWSNGSSDTSTIARGSGQITLSLTGSGSCVVSDTVDVTVNPFPDPDLGSDTTICAGDLLTLDATDGSASYLWQDNSTDSTLNVSSPGLYWVQTSIGSCIGSDTIDVVVAARPVVDLGNDTVICIGDFITLDATYNFASYLWQDNSTNATYNVGSSGMYWVESSIGSCSASDTINITVNPYPVLDLGNDTVMCSGEVITLDASYSTATYLWQDNSTSSTLNVNTTGMYWVNSSLGGCVSSDSVDVVVNPYPIVDLGNDTAMCVGDVLTLDASYSSASYLWQDNSTGPTHVVNSSGMYWVNSSLGGCSKNDTIEIVINPYPIVDLGNDTVLCSGEVLMLDATYSSATYLWQDNSTTATFNVNTSGIYRVATSIQNCSVHDTIEIVMEDCDTLLIIPNVFTPNGDGQNDIFKIVSDRDANFNMQVFNRWGQKIFETSSIKSGWDGRTVAGDESAQGTFFYLIVFGEKTYKGNVTLLR